LRCNCTSLTFVLLNTKRYFVELAYDGTNFHGWQIQPNANTVQACLDRALSTYFRQTVETVGCGRTDTGVHASQFYAHFDLQDVVLPAYEKSLNGINALLPYTISVYRFFEVEPNAHARFDALSRTYHYFFHFQKNPFLHQRSYLYRGQLDLDKMNQAAQLLLKYEDFSCFSKADTQTFTNNCNISYAYFEETANGIVFRIKANRFLRNMVRAIVGTLIMVGKGQLMPDEIEKIILSKDRSQAGQSAPACGLYLAHIAYPYISDNKCSTQLIEDHGS